MQKSKVREVIKRRLWGGIFFFFSMLWDIDCYNPNVYVGNQSNASVVSTCTSFCENSF